MNTVNPKIYIKHFRHFSERLALRYNILITFEQYVFLCDEKPSIVKTKFDDQNRKTILGYINFNDSKIKIIKSMWIEGKPLITALPMKHKFKNLRK